MFYFQSFSFTKPFKICQFNKIFVIILKKSFWKVQGNFDAHISLLFYFQFLWNATFGLKQLCKHINIKCNNIITELLCANSAEIRHFFSQGRKQYGVSEGICIFEPLSNTKSQIFRGGAFWSSGPPPEFITNIQKDIRTS